MILVYEYMLLGSLADHLHKRDRSGKSPLSWVQRLKICIGAARGLDYLHTGTSVLHRVIHRDVKSSNILLGETWAAKISDFGMSKIGPTNQSCSHVSTDVKGTFGYMDPEYYLTRRLTRKSDVYAFGVVLFEVLCGRPAVDVTLAEEQWGLAAWAKYCTKEGILDESIDPSLRGQILPNCLIAFVKIAEQCLHNFPIKRPTMAEVVVHLEYALLLHEKTACPVMEKGLYVIHDITNFSLLEERVTDTGGTSDIQDNEEPSAVQDIRKPARRMTFTRKVRQVFSVTARMISGPIKKMPQRRRATETGKEHGQYTSSNKVKKRVTQTSNSKVSLGNNTASKKHFSVVGRGEEEIRSTGQILRAFSFSELKAATKSFRNDKLLGEGGFGRVYKGLLVEKENRNGNEIAIKRLNSTSMQGFKEWLAEVNLLGIFSHPNIVRLLGYCRKDQELLLVYEFMQHGSLEKHLFRRGSAVQPLPWDIRLKVLIGAARGLAFLHMSEHQVIYRDFKTSNILLDGSYCAKLSDFGLAKYGPSADQTHVSTRVMGTQGYAAPEYIATGHLSAKSDVYCFGVVLVELLTGLRALDGNRPSGKHMLIDWAKPYLAKKSKLKSIMDARLEGKYALEAAEQIAQIALACLRLDPKSRPSMEEVVEKLE